MRKLVLRKRTLAGLGIVLATAVSLAHSSYGQQPEESSKRRAFNASRGEVLFEVKNKKSELKIVERFAKVVQLATKITRVDGFDPEIIDVTALTPHRIRVQAVTPGITTMVLVDEKGAMYTIDIFVTGDVRHLQAYVDRLFPNASVRAIEVRDSVVLRGWVSQPEHITELVEIAEQFYPRVINQIRVGGVQQVMLKVKVMEVQRSKVRKLGFNFLFLNDNGYLASTPGQLVTVGGITAGIGGGPGVNINGVGDPTISFGIINPSSIFQGFLEALKTEGLLKIKAEPTLVTMNGHPAELLNGGEFPVPVPQSLGTTTIEWREFGVRMEAVPQILGNGRLRLELVAEVSERDFTNSIVLGGVRVPGLTTRRANTRVEMKFGQTIVIAGLIANREIVNTSKIPLLGDMPWIGTAFSRKQTEEVETELVMMVTPEFVGPMDPSQVLEGGPGRFTDAPTFRELWNGHVEVPKYGDRCEGCVPDWGEPIVPGSRGILPDSSTGSGNSHPIIPPAPSAEDNEQAKSSFSKGLRRLNPFRRPEKPRPAWESEIQQAGYRSDQPPGNARQAIYNRPGTRRDSRVKQADGRFSEAAKTRSSRPRGLIEPGPGLIQP